MLLQPLQQSARELAAMEATLHVLRNSSQQEVKLLTHKNGQSTMQREPLHPLAHSRDFPDNKACGCGLYQNQRSHFRRWKH